MLIKKLILGGFCAASCALVFANTVTIKEKIHLHDMDCNTFIELGPTYHEKIVYLAAGHLYSNDKDSSVKLDAVERAVPLIVEDCKKSPGTNFYEVVKVKYHTSN